MSNLIEQIAAQWDGCMYEGVGGDIDIGQAIRDAGKDLAKEAGAAAAAEPHHVIGYTWTQADGKHRSIGAAPHPTNAHNIEPIYYPLAALTSAPAVPEASGCSLNCTDACKAKEHGCASECPALPWQPTERHTIEGVVTLQRSSSLRPVPASQRCRCCPGGDHIFSRHVKWDAYDTERPAHFGNSANVFVDSKVTDYNANEGKRVRLTVEVLPTALKGVQPGEREQAP